jgi:hypothetical protein
MSFFDTSKSILENLYFMSGPILAVLGFFIFRQIKIAKEQLKIGKDQLMETQKQLFINSTRDSIKLAAEQINYYLTTLVPIANEELKKRQNLDFPSIDFKPTRFINQEVLDSARVTEILPYLKKMIDTEYVPTGTMNSLETFATFFVQKVADENVAFQSVGKSYCETVKRLSIELSTVRHDDDGYYRNTIVLYRLWNKRLEEHDLKKQKDLMEKQLMEMENEIKIRQDQGIKPIGTE